MNWRRVGTEKASLSGEVLSTRFKRKPPLWKLETANGATVYLTKGKKGTRKAVLWGLLLPDGPRFFSTRRHAIRYAISIEVTPSPDDGKVSL